MLEELLNEWEVAYLNKSPGTHLTSREMGLLKDFVNWLSFKGCLTQRAADGARFCPACHALLEEGSVYCDTCGTDTPRR